MTTATADILELRGAIATDRPSGEDLSYDAAFAEMERLATGRSEQQFGETVYAAEEPDWSVLELHAVELAHRTHDLRVGLNLTAGLLRTQGLVGLADGLELLAGWLEDEWESVHPLLDEDDVEPALERSNVLTGLCDDAFVLRGLRSATLAAHPVLGDCSLEDVRHARDGRDETTRLQPSEVEAVLSAADGAALKKSAGQVERSVRCLDRIERAFETKVGPAPNLDPLRSVLEEIQDVLGPRDDAPAAETANDTKPTQRPDAEDAEVSTTEQRARAATACVPETINGRSDVVTTLDALCEYYDRHEPSSPIPLLLRRARRLVDMDFLDIVRDLAPDGLADVTRWAGSRETRD